MWGHFSNRQSSYLEKVTLHLSHVNQNVHLPTGNTDWLR